MTTVSSVHDVVIALASLRRLLRLTIIRKVNSRWHRVTTYNVTQKIWLLIEVNLYFVSTGPLCTRDQSLVCLYEASHGLMAVGLPAAQSVFVATPRTQMRRNQ